MSAGGDTGEAPAPGPDGPRVIILGTGSTQSFSVTLHLIASQPEGYSQHQRGLIGTEATERCRKFHPGGERSVCEQLSTRRGLEYAG